MLLSRLWQFGLTGLLIIKKKTDVRAVQILLHDLVYVKSIYIERIESSVSMKKIF